MDTRLMEERLHETPDDIRTEPNGPPMDPRPAADMDGPPAALFAPDETQNFRSRWENIQIGFVDEPRQAVQHADELVADAIRRLTEVFARERDKLEHEWDKGDQVSTEDLRVALRRYRTFFDRLLKI
jgi:hypothetical protein